MRLRAANYEAMRLAFMRLRADAGFSYDTLSAQTGVSRMALINLEHGKNHGSLETWHRICQALNVPFTELVARLEDPPARTFVVPPKPARKATPRKASARADAAAVVSDKSQKTPRAQAKPDPKPAPAKKAKSVD